MQRAGYPVYLNIYDFTTCNGCLEPLGLGAYHTGLEIHNSEYCYSVVSSDPNESGVLQIDPQSAEYRFVRKVYLGEAMTTHQQSHLIVEQLAKEFTCGRYNVLSNNCNHFCSQLARRLLAVELPHSLFRATNLLAWLCCCLPGSVVNGQWALKRLVDQQKEQDKKQERELLLK